jgi:hypothetical protein
MNYSNEVGQILSKLYRHPLLYVQSLRGEPVQYVLSGHET